jgi:peroxiredoxin (alkyl hydroperoxide reductase subunit C)
MSYAKIGTPAPHFSLPILDPSEPDNAGKIRSLSDYKGSWLAFFFYPADFSLLCPTEILGFSDRKQEFDEIGCQILGCSTDTYFTHKAWLGTSREKNGIAGTTFPLAADHSGETARAYGVLIEGKHLAHRGLFLIDPAGVLRYSVITELHIGRSTDETLRVVQALQTGGVCPSDWRPGKPTLG